MKNSPQMIRAVKGTRDLLPPDTAVWNHVEAVARQVFAVMSTRPDNTANLALPSGQRFLTTACMVPVVACTVEVDGTSP